jgi:hypothetical protein
VARAPPPSLLLVLPASTRQASRTRVGNTGVLSLAGAGGSRIQVTINGDESLATSQVKIDLDANGDGTFEATLNKNWADLSA